MIDVQCEYLHEIRDDLKPLCMRHGSRNAFVARCDSCDIYIKILEERIKKLERYASALQACNDNGCNCEICTYRKLSSVDIECHFDFDKMKREAGM